MAWPHSPIRRRRRAFTLIELLVALAIGAILAASMFGSLYIAFKARQSADAAVTPVRGSEMAMDLLRADIEAAQPPAGLLEGPFEGTQGTGPNGSDVLSFYNNGYSPAHQDGIGEIKQVTLTLEQLPSGDMGLVRQVVGNLLSQVQVQPDEEVICRNVVTFNLQYFDGLQWQTSWDSTQYGNALPAAVQVLLEIRPNNDAKAPLVHLRRIFLLPCVSQPSATTGGGAPISGGGTEAGGGGNNAGAAKPGGTPTGGGR